MIDLLVYGSDSSTIHQLLMTGSHLATTSIQYTSINDLVAAHRKTKLGTFIDGICNAFHTSYGSITLIMFSGGSLLLADCGVCTIGNLDSCKKDTREILQKGKLKVKGAMISGC